ncbi:MAG TPA: hypothetical protein VI233_14945, partial [Puia sp.]
TMVGHTGGLPGFGSNWMMLTDYGVGVISFSNLTYASTAIINARVLDTLITLARLKPHPAMAAEILTQRKKELAALLPGWEGAKVSGIFAENFFLDYFVDSLRKEAAEVFGKAGKMVRVGEMRPDNHLRGSFIIECENGNVEVRFTLTPENPALIQEYHIRYVTGSGGIR